MYIRAASIETDVEGILSVCNACEPAYPVSADTVRAWLQNRAPGRITLRLVAVDQNGLAAGYSVAIHVPEAPANHFYAWLGVMPGYRCRRIGAALWEASLDFLHVNGAARVASECLDDDPIGLAFAEKRGFSIDRRKFHSALDLDAFDETPYLPAIAALEAQGICFCSLADFPDTPETMDKFYELNLATVRDIPGEDWDFSAYPQFFKESILGAPWFRREGQLLAVDGDAFVGLGSVSLNTEKQSAYNATTGVVHSHRGRKIALALKVLMACYARQHGARQVSTDNDSLNAPILAVNQKLGYQLQPGKYLLVRWL